jgi:CubicO group peptidase (beta-lactamase class C family)
LFTVEDLLKRHPVLRSSEPAGAPGFAVTVLGADDEAATVYRGCANLDWCTPIGPDTKFHAASLAKQFTALAILQLRDRGLLALDAPVTTFIPELQVAAGPITLRHLLSHIDLVDPWTADPDQ